MVVGHPVRARIRVRERARHARKSKLRLHARLARHGDDVKRFQDRRLRRPGALRRSLDLGARRLRGRRTRERDRSQRQRYRIDRARVEHRRSVPAHVRALAALPDDHIRLTVARLVFDLIDPDTRSPDRPACRAPRTTAPRRGRADCDSTARPLRGPRPRSRARPRVPRCPRS